MHTTLLPDPFAPDLDLSALEQYRREVKRLPRLSREEQASVIARARQRDRDAARALLENGLHWAYITACQIYEERRPGHVEILDLAEEATVRMLEQLPSALQAEDPVAYLMHVASRTMRIYCIYHAPLIQRPEWCTRDDLAEIDRYLPAFVQSLDEPLSEESDTTRAELLAAPAPVAPEDEHEARGSWRFARLYEAVKGLSPDQRVTIVRLYGLFGQPQETRQEIAESLQRQPRAISIRAYDARQVLKRRLEPYLAEMTSVRVTPTREEQRRHARE